MGASIRFLEDQKRDPLTRADIETLRDNGFQELADIAENYLNHDEQKWRNRLLKWLKSR